MIFVRHRTKPRRASFADLMMIEPGTAAEKVVSVLNYDGTPITADNIFSQIKGKKNE